MSDTIAQLRARLRIAWRYREWPWRIPTNVVKHLPLTPPTERDIARGEELARKHGWD